MWRWGMGRELSILGNIPRIVYNCWRVECILGRDMGRDRRQSQTQLAESFCMPCSCVKYLLWEELSSNRNRPCKRQLQIQTKPGTYCGGNSQLNLLLGQSVDFIYASIRDYRTTQRITLNYCLYPPSSFRNVIQFDDFPCSQMGLRLQPSYLNTF